MVKYIFRSEFSPLAKFCRERGFQTPIFSLEEISVFVIITIHREKWYIWGNPCLLCLGDELKNVLNFQYLYVDYLQYLLEDHLIPAKGEVITESARNNIRRIYSPNCELKRRIILKLWNLLHRFIAHATFLCIKACMDGAQQDSSANCLLPY